MKLVLLAATLAAQLSGRILLQVQQHGEGWYVDPVTYTRFYMGSPSDAYALLRSKGLGIAHQELARYLATSFPLRLSGRILLDVQSHGEAYYVIPTTRKGVYLGTPSYAYDVMRKYGLGITDRDLAKIPISPASARPITTPAPSPVVTTSATLDSLEQEAFALVNDYRKSKGFPLLQWDDAIAGVARTHSDDMANGRVPFGHDGFETRVSTLNTYFPIREASENVAYNQGYADPAQEAVTGWIGSTGHRLNMERETSNRSGMGVVKASDGSYYFTQLFATVAN
jgi:uncharacterized protein YkwD